VGGVTGSDWFFRGPLMWALGTKDKIIEIV
jgi:hypothetical protein